MNDYYPTSQRLILRNKIRQIIRQRRREITFEKRIQFAQQAASRIMKWPPLIMGKNIALFLSFDGELDIHPLINQLWQIGKKIFLPTIHPSIQSNLIFLRYRQCNKLILNRFNIAEPKLNTYDLISLNDLDVMIVPLVAFDKRGQRLGMGGGFYDRILQNWEQHGFQIIGYAYDCQFVDNIPIENWDIPLPAVITPSKLWIW